jgi:hypothetical protein
MHRRSASWISAACRPALRSPFIWWWHESARRATAWSSCQSITAPTEPHHRKHGRAHSPRGPAEGACLGEHSRVGATVLMPPADLRPSVRSASAAGPIRRRRPHLSPGDCAVVGLAGVGSCPYLAPRVPPGIVVTAVPADDLAGVVLRAAIQEERFSISSRVVAGCRAARSPTAADGNPVKAPPDTPG